MFKSEPNLFLSANNNIYSAKTLINKCKAFINEYNVPGNNNFSIIKKYINNCNIDELVKVVENTKESLMKLDQGFASEYMSLLEEYLNTGNISFSCMSAQEIMQYNIQMSAYTRDYNYSLLYMLEKYEESGMLTPELKSQLEMQRMIIRQYDIQDKMSVLSTTSQEYIDLYKENAECDKKLINLNPNLTNEEKARYLKEYENKFISILETLDFNNFIAKKTDELKTLEVGSEEYLRKENIIRKCLINYYKAKDNLTEEEKKQLAILENGVELNELYIEKSQNNGLFHPFVEREYELAIFNKKLDIYENLNLNLMRNAEDEYINSEWFERAWENTKTVVLTSVISVAGIVETITDDLLMLVTENVIGNDSIINFAKDVVSVNWSDGAYDSLVSNGHLNSYSIYSLYGDSFIKNIVDYAVSTVPYDNIINRDIEPSDLFGYIKEKTGVGIENTNLLNTNLTEINSIDNYNVDYNLELEFANDLKNAGYTDAQIATQFAVKASQCSDISAKRELYNFAYIYLENLTGSKEEAANLVYEAFNTQLQNRGMSTILIDENGIEYNRINQFNESNQAYTLEYITSEIDKMPESIRETIKEINIYDTLNPYDKNMSLRYNISNLVSAASGGNGVINMYANKQTRDTVVLHEAGHGFDTADDGHIGKYSESEEYKAAVEADLKVTGQAAVTEYGATNCNEDFAEAIALYLTDPENFEFPNRKKYFEKIIGT